MEIETTVQLEVDSDTLFNEIEDNIIDCVENALDANNNDFVTSYDLDDRISDLQMELDEDLREAAVDAVGGLLNNAIDDAVVGLLDTIEEAEQSQDFAISLLLDRIQVLEDRENSSLRRRLGRLWAKLAKINWYSPFIGPRR